MRPSLIDTDIFSFMLKKDKIVLENIQKYLKDFKRLNISIITYYEVLSGLKYASAINAQKTIIVGPKELEEKSVTVRDMITGIQEKILIVKLERYFLK